MITVLHKSDTEISKIEMRLILIQNYNNLRQGNDEDVGAGE
jgi:hypothetical protein